LKFTRITIAEIDEVAALHVRETTRTLDRVRFIDCIENFPSVLVRVDAELIGFAYSYRFAPDILELRNIVVASDYRNMGTGSQILRQFETEAKIQAFTCVILVNSTLYTGPANRKRPTNFYLKNGYNIVHSTEQTNVFAKNLV